MDRNRILRIAAIAGLALPGACTRKPPEAAASVRPDSTEVFLDACGFYGDSLKVMKDSLKLYQGNITENRELSGRSGDTSFFGPIAFLRVIDGSSRRGRYYFAFNAGGDMGLWKQAMFHEVLPRDEVLAGKAYTKEIQRNRNACVDAATVVPEPPADIAFYEYSEMSVSDLFRIRGIDSALLDLEIDVRYFTGFARDHPEWEEHEGLEEPVQSVKVREIYGGKAENFQHVPVTEAHLRRLKLSHTQLLKAGASRKR